MYEKQFGLTRRPFCSVPDPLAYFPSSSADSALDSLRLCVERAAGPALLIGGSGHGKSLLLAVLHKEFQSQFRVARIEACNRLSRRHDLLQNILFELGQPYRERSEGELRLQLIDYLRSSTHCPNGLLLLVDDGHQLPGRLLDEMRLFTNFVRDGQPRVRMVLAGTAKLEERLNQPQLDAFNQRLGVRCYLKPLRRDELSSYIHFQLQRAGADDRELFSARSIEAVAQLCDNNPRLINQVCDYALILAASAGLTSINDELVAEAFSDIQRLPANVWQPPAAAEKEKEAKPTGEWSVVEFGELDGAESATFESNDDDSGDEVPTEMFQSTVAEVDSVTSDDESSAFELDDDLQTAEALKGESIDPVESITEMVDELSETLLEELRTAPATDLDAVSSEWICPTLAIDPFDDAYAAEQMVDQVAPPHAKQMPTSSIDDQAFHSACQKIIEIRNDVQRSYSAKKSTSKDSVDQVDDDNESTAGAVEYPVTEYPNYHASTAPEVADGANNRGDTATDDRDMILVTNLGRPPSRSKSEPQETSGSSVSKGRAVRVEYKSLFRQLRNDSK